MIDLLHKQRLRDQHVQKNKLSLWNDKAGRYKNTPIDMRIYPISNYKNN